ncbi:hypothetical protein [Streptomyces sp. NPDC101776]|uniref:hypothetical protein n=1 Tax=Streptomyces sp. NPDC101776 TaxID=3366146 RepID=UPI00381A568C
MAVERIWLDVPFVEKEQAKDRARPPGNTSVGPTAHVNETATRIRGVRHSLTEEQQ